MDLNEKFIEKNIAELSQLNLSEKDFISGPHNGYNPLIPFNCVDCGKFIVVRKSQVNDNIHKYGHDIDHRCQDCLKKWRSEHMKNAPNSIGTLIKEKCKDPEYSKVYKEELSKRAISIWENKTPEERNKWKSKFFEGHKKRYENLTKEEKLKIAKPARIYYATRSESERLRHNRLLSQKRKEYFANMSEEERKKYSDFCKEIYNKQSDEWKKGFAERSLDQWMKLTQEEKDKKMASVHEGAKKFWENMTPEQRIARGENISKNYKNKSPEEKMKIREKHVEYWKNMTPEEKYEKCHNSGYIKSNGEYFNVKFEKAFKDSILSDSYYLVPRKVFSGGGITKEWDYAIYSSEDNKLVMLVDLDGSFTHADGYDYNGMQSKEEYDEARFVTAPEGVKACIIYYKEFYKSFGEIIKLIKTDYDEYINDVFKYCRSIPFPYPHYTDIELHRSWDYLCKQNNDNRHLNFSVNTRLGDSIIKHFHHSIWHAHVKGKPSPYDAWYNDDLLKEIIRNRIIYINHLNPNKILQGFNICKKAPKVSVFSAGRAKLIIDKYLHEYDIIFDPFSGFGGRMLGAIAAGKKYIGQDIADRYISENIDILQYFKLQDFANLRVMDVFDSSGEYPCLFTCPPYKDKEFWECFKDKQMSCDDWIDECLKRFKCKRYVFVVDSTEKYQANIVDYIVNKSHFGENKELIILINRKE